MKKLNTFARLAIASSFAFGAIAPVATMVAPIHAQEGEMVGMYDTHNIENLKIELDNQLTANGEAQTQKVKVTCEEENLVLEEGVDYKLENNVVTDAGDYKLTVKGINDYHGEKEINFTVAQEDQPVGPIDGMYDTHNIENLNVRLADQLTANGDIQAQKVVISCSEENVVLEEGVDYEIGNNRVQEAGDYTLTVRGINDYHGEVKVNFTVAEEEKPVGPIDGMYDTHNIENLNVRLADQLTANGTNQAQKIVITCEKENLVLEEGVDYVLSNNVVQNAGNYTLTAKGINDYHGEVQVSFTVAQATNKDKDGKDVHTGTNTNAIMYVGLGAMATAALGAIAVMMTRKNKA